MKLNTHINGGHEPSKSHIDVAEPNPLCTERTGVIETDAGLGPLKPDDIDGDIGRIITKAITPYIDNSHPFFHFDDLHAECRAKLAKVCHNGSLAKCPTRAKALAYLKTCFRNLLRSLVQKHMYSAKRTGVRHSRGKPGPGEDAASVHKPHHVSIDDAENVYQLGAHDPSFRRNEFMEELTTGLSAPQSNTLEFLISEKAVFSAEGDGTEAPTGPRRTREPTIERPRT